MNISPVNNYSTQFAGKNRMIKVAERASRFRHARMSSPATKINDTVLQTTNKNDSIFATANGKKYEILSDNDKLKPYFSRDGKLYFDVINEKDGRELFIIDAKNISNQDQTLISKLEGTELKQKLASLMNN